MGVRDERRKVELKLWIILANEKNKHPS